MVLESNRDLVLRRLLECLGRDRTKHQVAEVTSLGLVQMTRKRVGQGLHEVVLRDLRVLQRPRRTTSTPSRWRRPAAAAGGKRRRAQERPQAAAAEAAGSQPAGRPPDDGRRRAGKPAAEARRQPPSEADRGRRGHRVDAAPVAVEDPVEATEPRTR